jgi:hypothetical protein
MAIEEMPSCLDCSFGFMFSHLAKFIMTLFQASEVKRGISMTIIITNGYANELDT